jgi:hypothetical protein
MLWLVTLPVGIAVGALVALLTLPLLLLALPLALLLLPFLLLRFVIKAAAFFVLPIVAGIVLFAGLVAALAIACAMLLPLLPLVLLGLFVWAIARLASHPAPAGP